MLVSLYSCESLHKIELVYDQFEHDWVLPFTESTHADYWLKLHKYQVEFNLDDSYMVSVDGEVVAGTAISGLYATQAFKSPSMI